MGEGLHDRARGRQRSGANRDAGTTLVQGTLDRLTPRTTAWTAYCVAHVGKSLLWAAGDLLTLYVLVTVYAMDPAVAGVLFRLALAANAGADLAAGIWLDRHPRHGAAVAAGALTISAVSFPATMLLAPHGPGAVLVAMLVSRIAYAGYDVPHNALMSRLAPAPAQAAWLSRGRTIGTGIAAFAAAVALGDVADVRAIAPVLVMLAAAAFVIGIALVPLLARGAKGYGMYTMVSKCRWAPRVWRWRLVWGAHRRLRRADSQGSPLLLRWRVSWQG